MFLWFIVAVALRCRFQLGVGSLLVLTLAVAVACSWIAVGVKRAVESADWVRGLLMRPQPARRAGE
jgi:hypothetical protein